MVASTCSGEAPRDAAASRWRGSIALIVGKTVRATMGIATMDWAIGTSHHDVAKFRGGPDMVTRKPKPTVTADTPSGSINRMSNAFNAPFAALLRGLRDRITDSDTPTASASTAATSAVAKEVPREESTEVWMAADASALAMSV